MKLAVALAVLLALALVLDRVAVAVAQRAAAKVLGQHADFVGSPHVQIHGFPFLTQVLEGSYDDIEVSAAQLRLGSVTAQNVDVRLRGVQISLYDALRRSAQSVRCRLVDGSLVLPYSSLAALSGIAGLQLSWQAGQIRATAALPELAGRSVVAVASVAVTDGSLGLRASQVSVGGVALTAAQLVAVDTALSVPIALPELPYQLRVETASAGASGVTLHASAALVTLQVA